MRKAFLTVMMLIAASLFVACDQATTSNSASNTATKPAGNSAAPAADAAAIETEIKKLANDGVAATLKNDTATLEKLWNDNYVFVGQDGAVATKADRIKGMKDGTTKIEALAYDEMSVRSNAEGTGAILIGRVTVKGTHLGNKVDGQMRFTQVWSKTKDGWRAVSGQVTPITAAAKPDDKKADAAPAANANK